MNVETSKIVLQPYDCRPKAFRSVAPSGWTAIAPGIHMQRPNGTTILQTAFPTTNISELLASLMSHTGMKEMPIAVDIQEANGLLWKLYTASSEKRMVDIALAQAYGMTYVILVQSLRQGDVAATAQLFQSIIANFMPDAVPA